MSKYILELKDDIQVVQKVGVTENGNAFVMNFYKDQLEELNSDYINEHFGSLQDDAYKMGINDDSLDVKQRVEGAYQKGFEDGKAVNDKGCEGCKYSGTPQGDSPCFNCSNYYQNNWTAKDDKIEVGDEVYCKGDDESDSGVVTWAGKDRVCAMWQDGSAGEVQKDELIKTGRHFDIKSILEAMRYD